jgi:hypothetical protein
MSRIESGASPVSERAWVFSRTRNSIMKAGDYGGARTARRENALDAIEGPFIRR